MIHELVDMMPYLLIGRSWNIDIHFKIPVVISFSVSGVTRRGYFKDCELFQRSDRLIYSFDQVDIEQQFRFFSNRCFTAD